MDGGDGGISLQVALLSGETVQLHTCRDETVNELRLQTQQQLGVKVSNLVATDGRLLNLSFTDFTAFTYLLFLPPFMCEYRL